MPARVGGTDCSKSSQQTNREWLANVDVVIATKNVMLVVNAQNYRLQIGAERR